MTVLPISQFSVFHNRKATLIWGISKVRLSVVEAKNQFLDIFEEFDIPCMEINTACIVIWFNSEIDTCFKTCIAYYIEIPSYLHIIASLERQFFFQDLKYCNGQLEWRDQFN